MRVVKKYLLSAMLFFCYIAVISFLLHQFYTYQTAYQELSRMISHPSIETNLDKKRKE